MHRALFECVASLTPDNCDPIDPEVKDYKWISISDIGELISNEMEDVVEIISGHGYFELLKGGKEIFSEGSLRSWELTSWFKNIYEKASLILSNLGYTLTAAFEQHKISPSSVVIRIGNNKGRVYFKASTGREGGTTQFAARLAPFLVRKPLYVNAE